MSDEAQGFKVTNVRMQDLPSDAKGQDGIAESAQKEIASASVQCLKCGETWTATEGGAEKSLSNVLGGVVLTCPKCGQTGGVQRSEYQ